MRALVVSVGTSLLTNFRQQAGTDQTPAAATLVAYLDEMGTGLASAESNSLEQLALLDGDRLIWLHSDTSEGRLCAEALQARYLRDGWRGELRQIGGLGYHERSFAERGLASLVAATFQAIDSARRRGEVVEICATGGFKAEIAYLNLVGALSGVPVHYIHDRFRELVTLPALPLRWNSDWVAAHASFFAWIDEEPRDSASVDGRLKAVPELRQLVADDPDGHTFLNAAGELLYSAYRTEAGGEPRATWPAASELAPWEKDIVSKEAHHRPAGWQGFVARLCAIDCVSQVRYAGEGHGRGGARLRVYREDAELGILGIGYGAGDEVLPLEVATTARGAAQLALVRGWIERNMRKW